MSTEIYSLSNDFNNKLLNHHLIDDINNNTTILKVCLDVSTEGDEVHIKFDDVLTTEEKTELNNIVTNYVYDYDGDIYINVVKNMDFPAGILTQYDNWDSLSGKLKGFDKTTGIFTIPEDGIYTFGLSLLFDGLNNIDAVTRLYDPNLNYTWLISSDRIKSINGESGFIIGLSNYLKKGLQFKLESLFDVIETNVTIKLRIIKL